jgi:hypothetical protein
MGLQQPPPSLVVDWQEEVDQRQVPVPEQVGKLVPAAHLRQEPPAEEDVAARRDPRNVFAVRCHLLKVFHLDLVATLEKRDRRGPDDRESAAGRDVLFDRAQNAVKLSSAKKTYLTSASASQQQLEAAAAG